jgi:hypothetical protein
VAVFQRRASVAVLAGLAVGLVITTASGELRADRDVEHELLRANEALAEQLTRQGDEIAALRSMVAAAAGRPSPSNPGTTQPSTAPESAVKANVKETLAFRKKVLAAMKPELEAIDARATEATEKFDKHVDAYAKHRHDYEITGHGWVRLDTMLTTEGVEMLRPTYSNDWIPIRTNGNGGMIEKTTTKPK